MTQKSKAGIYYDNIAAIYDKSTTTVEAWASPKIVGEKLLNYVKPNDNILDIGIGTGQAIEKLILDGREVSIYGVDLSKEMLKICRSKYPQIKLVEGEVTDIQHTEFKNITFDVIVSSGALKFIEQLEPFFKQIKKILKPKGYFIFTYEPYIVRHPIMGEEISTDDSSSNSKHQVDGFTTYRRSPNKILNLIKEQNLTLIEDIEFVAYPFKGSHVIYHLMVVQNE